MRDGFAVAIAAELVVVVAIFVCAAVIVNAGAIGMDILEFFQ